VRTDAAAVADRDAIGHPDRSALIDVHVVADGEDT
jgi:hypothetical protein